MNTDKGIMVIVGALLIGIVCVGAFWGVVIWAIIKVVSHVCG